jgi:hypothetical protein
MENKEKEKVDEQKEKTLNEYFKIALMYHMLRKDARDEDAGVLLYKILLNELNNMAEMVKDVDKCKTNISEYMHLHTKWQIRYNGLVGNIVISNNNLTKTRAKIHEISCILYSYMPDQMVHPVYKNYVGNKNGDLYSKYTKKLLNCNPKNGYMHNSVTIDENNNHYKLYRHRFILECFLQVQLDSKIDVDHINSNKLDNSITNLQFMTRLEHVKKTHSGKPSTGSVSRSIPIIRFKLDNNGNRIDVKKYINATEAGKDPEINCCSTNIIEVLKGKGKQRKGYFWEYVVKKSHKNYKGEIWKKIKDIDDKFGETKAEISNFGRVKSSYSVISFGGKDVDGYFRVQVNRKCYKIHQLVLRAFIGPPPTNLHTCDHIDQDKCNNKLENLRWVTPIEQSDNSCSKPVNAYKNNIFVGSYKSYTVAASELGISRPTIGLCVLEKKATENGYTFKLVGKNNIATL